MLLFRDFRLFFLLVLFAVMPVSSLYASVYNMPDVSSRTIGEDVIHNVRKGDDFQALAEQYNVGFLALLEANPTIDPYLPAIDSKVIIPKKMLLPFGKREGIVVNLAELRLYYFPPNEKLVYVFPVAIGKQGMATPTLTSVISEKRKDPQWRPTNAMRARYLAKNGKEMAKAVPAGPNNPFGKYALRLGTSEYLIHGTNKRFGIGMRASSGCMRLYNDDIEWLYHNVAVGTQVKILDQPIKMAYEKAGQFIEIHQEISVDNGQASKMMITDAVKRFVADDQSKMDKIATLLAQPQGLVVSLDL